MSVFLKMAGRWGGILTIIALIITLLTTLIKFVTFMMTALKIIIVLMFVGLMIVIILSILRGRRSRRREAEDF
ncbi:MAG: hypothetical protein H7Y30_10805 [Pyrinomonadaceae bacterium]|nr:hypothetical protein [Pyrinomonadaceae bacterium]